MMDRRQFLRMAASAAAALGLVGIGGAPIKVKAPKRIEAKGSTFEWRSPRTGEWQLINGAVEAVLTEPGRLLGFPWGFAVGNRGWDAIELGALKPLDWDIRVVYTEADEPTIDLAAINAGDWAGHEWYDERVGAWRQLEALYDLLWENADLEEITVPVRARRDGEKEA